MIFFLPRWSVSFLLMYLLQFSVSISVYLKLLVPLFIHVSFLQEDETDYYDSHRSQHRFEDDLEAEARAEKRIMNAKKVLSFGLLKFVHGLIVFAFVIDEGYFLEF